jgi:hydroxymethylbilane synthase
VQSRLEAAHSGLRVELREYVTQGDRVQNVPLAQVGGKGLFTKEIEDALLHGEADLAVHSLKDLPEGMPAGLMLGAVPAREDPRDALVLPASVASGTETDAAANPLDRLPHGARVGSSSVRRAAQLRHLRPDLHLEDVRGNVDTRLRKLDEGQYDALILASAGLRRLNLAARITAALPPELCLPAPGQGALALQCREEDAATQQALRALDDPEARVCVVAERAALAVVGGGCSVPLGALARLEGRFLVLQALVASPDGSRILRAEQRGEPTTPQELGRAVAEQLLADGAAELLAGK